MQTIINAQAPEFKVQAFQNGEFKTVSSDDIKGKWAIFFFYPADFTFVVNPQGLIKLVEMQDNSIGRNADELVRKVKAAQFVESHPGEVCPAKWNEGADTLKPSIDLVGKL